MTNHPEDPRIAATRQRALGAALNLMVERGVLDVTHQSVSKETGISRSTLYRHWPCVEQLRSDVFLEAAKIPGLQYETRGSLAEDLRWVLENLVRALDTTPWGKIAAHSVSVAASDVAVRTSLNALMAERRSFVASVIGQAKHRGEIDADVTAEEVFDVAIGVPYFRRLIEGMPLDERWLDAHVRLVCRLVGCPSDREPALSPANERGNG